MSLLGRLANLGKGFVSTKTKSLRKTNEDAASALEAELQTSPPTAGYSAATTSAASGTTPAAAPDAASRPDDDSADSSKPVKKTL